MELTVSQPELARALARVSRAVSHRSLLPVLSHLLLVARPGDRQSSTPGRLQLAATDLELCLTTWLEAEVTQPGAITIPARPFTELVNTLPAEDLHLNLETPSQILGVHGQGSTTHLKGMDAQEFPQLPQADGQNSVQFLASELRAILRRVTLAASKDEARSALTGVFVKLVGQQASFAAADGFRLAVHTATLPAPVRENCQYLIPARALEELGRVLTDSPDLVDMLLPTNAPQILFRTSEIELSSQLIDANFPEYEAVIPTEHAVQAVVPTPDFLKACKQAEIFARDSANTARLELLPEDEGLSGKLKLFAQADETGSNETCLEAEVKGKPVQIAFNVRFLRDVLEVIQTPHVRLEANQANTPGVLRPHGEEGYLCVLMPMYAG
ncbi:MAG: DNA polymerase III subunit beta [Anaerolineales bacterium]|nr:DNA polymerase III subunit beta [Anaerolineales bacterium]